MQHPTEGLKVDSIIAPCHPAWSGVTKKPATPTDSRTLLANPEALPFRDIRTIDRQRVLIVAPHPDDETLGCGGAISLLCRQGYDVNVLIVSDGTGSHPNSQKYPAPILRWIRSQETLTALAILGVNRWAVTFLHLKDGAIPTVTAPKFHAAKVRCRKYLQATLPDTIFVPWRRDPHPDHRATWQLIQAAILSLGMMPQVIEYPIWDWDIQQQTTANLHQIAGWRLDIQSVLGQKTQAIDSYRSQLGQLIDDDPHGFCLSADMLVNFTRPWEVYFEEMI
jgi:LmbE family N-acetylglucosaminyl deacetylase